MVVIARSESDEAIQRPMDCFASLAMTVENVYSAAVVSATLPPLP
jgi:hypothetical protein